MSLHDDNPRKIAELELALRRMERFAALVLLDWRNQEGVRFEMEDAPESVAAIVNEYNDCDIGKCDRCGAHAPVNVSRDRAGRVCGRVCAWGCEDRDALTQHAGNR